MHIGILLTGHAPEAILAREGDYSDMFETLLADRGLYFTTWSVVDGEFPPDIQAAQGWLITGSRHGVYEEHDWIAPLEAHIRDCYAAEVPVVGICFGHQIVAQALGGTVEKFSGGWAVGATAYDWADGTVTLNAWHQDQVVRKPAAADVVASAPDCDYAALVYKNTVFTVQAHPEFGAHALESLIDTRGPGLIPDDLLESARARLTTDTDSALIADRIAEFFKDPNRG